MSSRTQIYKGCLMLYPLALISFALGFGFPAWREKPNGITVGLWQMCNGLLIANCQTLQFNSGMNWEFGVRVVEVFAAAMMLLAVFHLTVENYMNRFGFRSFAERLAAGTLCLLGGSGGLAGMSTCLYYTINDGANYGDADWALALNGAGSGLAFLLGILLMISGCCIESSCDNGDAVKSSTMNGMSYLPPRDDNHELTNAYTNQAMTCDEHRLTHPHSLPGYISYTGHPTAPAFQNPHIPPGEGGQNTHVPPGGGGQSPHVPPGGVGQEILSVYKVGVPVLPKPSKYFSMSDDRTNDPNYDLSEGFPARPFHRSSNVDSNHNAGDGFDAVSYHPAHSRHDQYGIDQSGAARGANRSSYYYSGVLAPATSAHADRSREWRSDGLQRSGHY